MTSVRVRLDGSGGRSLGGHGPGLPGAGGGHTHLGEASRGGRRLEATLEIGPEIGPGAGLEIGQEIVLEAAGSH